MTAAAMRKELIAWLSDADDKKIKGLYTLLEANIGASGPELTAAELALVNKERKLHISGTSKSYTWTEAKELIRKKKAS